MLMDQYSVIPQTMNGIAKRRVPITTYNNLQRLFTFIQVLLNIQALYLNLEDPNDASYL